jgi:hypothetical protein
MLYQLSYTRVAVYVSQVRNVLLYNPLAPEGSLLSVLPQRALSDV